MACIYTFSFYRAISVKLGVMIETTELYILMSVWMTLTFIQGHSCMRNQNFGVHFLRNFAVNFFLCAIQCVATTCRFIAVNVRFVSHK